MYICCDCGAIFRDDEAGSHANYEHYGSACVLEDEYDICPECHSDDLDEAKICCICEKGFADYDVESIDCEDNETRYICDECLKRLQNEFDNWINAHNENEREIIIAYSKE